MRALNSFNKQEAKNRFCVFISLDLTDDVRQLKWEISNCHWKPFMTSHVLLMVNISSSLKISNVKVDSRPI